MDELIPVWNGQLEKDRHAPGLSTYYGKSSLFHSSNWTHAGGLEHGECGRVPMAPEAGAPMTRLRKAWNTTSRRVRNVDAWTAREREPRAERLTPEQRQAAAAICVELRNKGVSWRHIAKAAGVTWGQARHLVKAA